MMNLLKPSVFTWASIAFLSILGLKRYFTDGNINVLLLASASFVFHLIIYFLFDKRKEKVK